MRSHELEARATRAAWRLTFWSLNVIFSLALWAIFAGLVYVGFHWLGAW